jgi:hypothetical protein
MHPSRATLDTGNEVVALVIHLTIIAAEQASIAADLICAVSKIYLKLFNALHCAPYVMRNSLPSIIACASTMEVAQANFFTLNFQSITSKNIWQQR